MLLALLFASLIAFCELQKIEVRNGLCDNCINKCCPLGKVYTKVKISNMTKSVGMCVPGGNVTDLLLGKEHLLYRVSFNDDTEYTKEEVGSVFLKDKFSIVSGINCGKKPKHYYKSRHPFNILEDGQLFIELPNAIPPWTLRGPDKYCIDTFVSEVSGVKTSHLDALVCFGDQDSPHYILSSSCMLISCVFILATVAVYAWLPELRNLHGRVLITYLLCLFVAFGSLSFLQIMLHINYIFTMTCLSLTIVIYFSLLSAFFWLNVMCFDIWWTFSGKRGLSNRFSSIKARFLAYCVYAFGIPSLLTIVLISLEFSGLPPHPMMPLLRHQGCFIFGTSKLVYLYSPMLMVCLSNLVFFVLTALKINEIKKQTSVLKSQDNGTHDQHRKDKQRLTLYFKLFMVMGINWVLEVVSAVYPDIQYLWNFTDAYNVLIGLTIFIIFVCKRKIFRLIKKRIKNNIQNSNEDVDEMKDFSNAQIRRKQLVDQRASQETIRTSIGSANSNKIIANII